ncbi:MAG: cytochrome c [Hyphomicrobiaceae bacterium]
MLVRATPLLLAFAIASLSTATASAADELALATHGKALLTQQCARCHAIEREGASPLAAAPPFRDIHRKYPVEQLAEAFAEGIVTGHPAMPEFIFTPEEIDAILAHLGTLSDTQ